MRASASRILRARRPSRTREFSYLAVGPDIRRTIRQFVRRGGLYVGSVRRRKLTRPGRLVVLWDVSGSMAETIPLYLPWLHRVALSARDVGIFPFGVRLEDLTPVMRQPYANVLSAVAATSDLWEGAPSLGRRSMSGTFAMGQDGFAGG
ncbi:hypothetical protein GCM10025859_50540 [Alicyclobacillus fastidiosus]|nr:hypothetical protein GCM10025859_50540 [Alicyclobacillus fastidiosus]